MSGSELIIQQAGKGAGSPGAWPDQETMIADFETRLAARLAGRSGGRAKFANEAKLKVLTKEIRRVMEP